MDEVASAEAELKIYIASEFRSLLANPDFVVSYRCGPNTRVNQPVSYPDPTRPRGPVPLLLSCSGQEGRKVGQRGIPAQQIPIVIEHAEKSIVPH